ncbi:MAG: NADH-quinone oxidoreductase subunit N [Nitrospirae bacterium]|nr:NADH-quinone oxidoreductase subunit N [Nitrospirota bacterium]
MFETINMKILLPELILICTGLAVILLDLVLRKKETVAFIGVAGALLSAYYNFSLMSLGWSGAVFQNMFVLDGYSSFFKLIFYISLIITIFISLNYIKTERVSSGEYYSLLLFSASGMMIMAGAADFMVLYLGIELMSLSLYILAGIMRERRTSNEAAIKYFFLGAFSSAFLLFGISLTYGLTGTTSIIEVAEALNRLGPAGRNITLIAVIFFVTAFGFKVALVPFHMWAPDVYEGAPTSVTAFMSTGPKAAAFAVMGRVLFYAFGALQLQWSAIIEPLSIVTIAVGSILALSQTNIKRMLAYSAIAHAGYASIGFLPGTQEAFAAMINYLMIYIIVNLGAFAVVVIMRREGIMGEELSDYSGLAKKNPLVAFLMLIFMFSLTGIPPLAGFIGKFYIFMGAVEAGYTKLVIAAVIFSAVSAFFYLRVVVYMYMKEAAEPSVLIVPHSVKLVLAFTSIMAILLGIFPSVLLDFARASLLG